MVKRILTVITTLLLMIGFGISSFLPICAEKNYDGSETDTTGWIRGWSQRGLGGSVEWAVDPEGTLWLRPINGASTGKITQIDEQIPMLTVDVGNNHENYAKSFKIKNGTTITIDTNDYSVTNLFSGIGYNCSGEKGVIDLTGLDLSKVTHYSLMFSNVYVKEIIGLDSLDTSQVTDMSNMFYGSSIDTIDVSNFDTSNVTSMAGMFMETNLKNASLDLSRWDVSSVVSIADMFNNFCQEAEVGSLNLSGWNLKKLYYHSSTFQVFFGTFSNAKKINIDISKWKIGEGLRLDTSVAGDGDYYESSFTSFYSEAPEVIFTNEGTTYSMHNWNDNYSLPAVEYNFSNADMSKSNIVIDVQSSSPQSYAQLPFFAVTASKLIFGIKDNSIDEAPVGDDWVKIRDGNGVAIFDETTYTGEQIMNLSENTTPTLSGTWMRKSSPEYATRFDHIEYISEQGNNSNNHWVKNGDTWTYTFDVFDDSVPYYIWEDKLDGYTSTVMKPAYDTMNENGEKYYEILNISNQKSSLEISKKVTGKQTDQVFDFTITIDNWPGTYVKSGVVFTDGVGHIKLAHNETKLIEGLPANKTYTVTEKVVSPYTTSSQGDTGTLEAGKTSKAEFTNLWRDIQAEHPERYNDLTLKKFVEGNSEKSKQFKFFVSFTGLEPNMTYDLSNENSFVSDLLGNANIEVTLRNGQTVIFESLPVGSNYQITEEAGAYTAAYNITGNGEVIQSANQNTKENQQLSTAIETIETGEDGVVTFTNAFRVYQDLKVSKTVIGTSEDKSKQFNFEIEFFGMEPNSAFNSDIGRVVADDEGYAIKGFSLIDGEIITFNQVPVGVQYRIKELKNDYLASYDIYNPNNPTNISTADVENFHATNPTTKMDLSTELETVNEGENAEIKFTNERRVDLKIAKKTTHTTEEKFRFKLKLSKGTIPNTLPTGAQASFVDDEGNTVKVATIADFTPVEGEENAWWFELGSDEAFVIKELPFETNFEISEEAKDMWTLESIKEGETTASATGTLTTNSSRTFTNRKLVGSLTLKKVVDGNMGDRYKKFKFTVEFMPEIPYDISTPQGCTLTDETYAIYECELAHNESVTFQDIPEGHTYEVTETDYSTEGYRTYVNNGIIQDREAYGTIEGTKEVTFRNIRGAAVPTEIRFWWWLGIPLSVIGILSLMILNKKKELQER